MKKNWIALLSLCSVFALAVPAAAEEGAGSAANAGEAKAEKRTGRKKRQLMCRDCGKPEKNCECEGEQHRKGEGHAAHGESKAEDKR